MATNRISKICAAVAVAIMAASMSVGTQAGAMNDKMQAWFGSMTNTTKPAVINMQRRGVIAGGSFAMRNKITDTSLVNIALPHADGGCGGIDIFGGSASFINAKQFVELLRNIASNAQGYAFHLAIHAASEMIGGLLQDLEHVIQALNSMNINSCNLAQGIVNNAVDAALGNQLDFQYLTKDFGDIAQAYNHYGTEKKNNPGKSVVDAIKSARQSAGVTGDSSGNPQKKGDNTADGEHLWGNIMWQELHRNKMATMFKSAKADDNKEYGIIMAVTGALIIQEPKQNEKDATSNEFPSQYVEPILDPEDLIKGGEIQYYNCSGECLDLSPKNHITKEKIVGMKDRIYNAIKGDGNEVGIIQKYRTNKGKFTDTEKGILSAMPAVLGSILNNLATSGAEIAEDYAQELSMAVAMHYAFDMILERIQVARLAVGNSKIQQKDDLLKRLDNRYAEIQRKAQEYYRKHKSSHELLTEYLQMQNVMDKANVRLVTYMK